MTSLEIAQIKQLLGIDLADTQIRQRAWQRMRVFREIADECDADGNTGMAETLRRICQQAFGMEQDAISMALLAGPEDAR